MTKKKVTKLIQKVKGEKFRLCPDDIQYIIELCQENPRWSVDRIFRTVLRPRIRTFLYVPLTPKLNEAMKKAAKKYEISIADITYHILQEWLEANGLLKK